MIWIGRLFTLDNDDGAHWVDSWHLREPVDEAVAQRGLPYEELLIIDPERFQDGKDGPCHPPALRKRFWTNSFTKMTIPRRYVPWNEVAA